MRQLDSSALLLFFHSTKGFCGISMHPGLVHSAIQSRWKKKKISALMLHASSVLESHTDKKKKRNKSGKELLVGVEKNCNVKCSGQNDLDWEVICKK